MYSLGVPFLTYVTTKKSVFIAICGMFYLVNIASDSQLVINLITFLTVLISVDICLQIC